MSSALWCHAWLIPGLALAAIYEVGPGQPYTNINDVPWESIAAGDTVLIHARSTPYNEKWVISAVGTPSAPITVRGVPDSMGNLPVIDGANATTRTQLNFYNEDRGVVKVGGANIPPVIVADYVVIENLHVRSARAGVPFTNYGGGASVYLYDAAGIYIEGSDHVTVRGCELEGNGNGIFAWGMDTQILESHLHDNGDPAGNFGHNLALGSFGGLVETSRFGPPCPQCLAASGLYYNGRGATFRYNWIEGGHHLLDVESSTLDTDPADPSREHFLVYGNIFLESAGAGAPAVHFAGTQTTPTPEQGTLFFWQNTLLSQSTGVTILSLVDPPNYAVAAFNNVVHNATGGGLVLLSGSGSLSTSGNWFTSDVLAGGPGAVVHLATDHQAADPLFEDATNGDLRLSPLSPALDLAGPLPPELSSYPLDRQYRRHQMDEPRLAHGPVDPGALESPWWPPSSQFTVGCGCSESGGADTLVWAVLVMGMAQGPVRRSRWASRAAPNPRND